MYLSLCIRLQSSTFGHHSRELGSHSIPGEADSGRVHEPGHSQQYETGEQLGSWRVHTHTHTLTNTHTLINTHTHTHAHSQTHTHQTPLHLAVITRQPLMVRLLVGTGASVNFPDRKGNTALHLAAARRDVRILQLLAQATNPLPDYNAKNFSGEFVCAK